MKLQIRHHQMKKTIYFHVPKTAGTSLIEVLCYLYGAQNEVICPAVVDDDLVLLNQHVDISRFSLFKGHFSLDLASRLLPSLDEYIKITTLRNPIDRCISLYSYLRGHPQASIDTVNEYQKLQILYAKSFDLIEIIALPDHSAWKNEYTRMFSQFSDYSCTPKEMANAIIATIDVIGFLDNLADFHKCIKALLWNQSSIDLAMPHQRRSSDTSHTSHYKQAILANPHLLQSFEYDSEVYSLLLEKAGSTGLICSDKCFS
jgi:hypothetical protein